MGPQRLSCMRVRCTEEKETAATKLPPAAMAAAVATAAAAATAAKLQPRLLSCLCQPSGDQRPARPSSPFLALLGGGPTASVAAAMPSRSGLIGAPGVVAVTVAVAVAVGGWLPPRGVKGSGSPRSAASRTSASLRASCGGMWKAGSRVR